MVLGVLIAGFVLGVIAALVVRHYFFSKKCMTTDDALEYLAEKGHNVTMYSHQRGK